MQLPETFREVLDAEPAIAFARLFGSRSRGNPRADSDWDIAVYLDESLGAERRFAIRRQLSAALSGPAGPEVDVIILNDAPPLLAHRALQGSELFTRDRRAYVRFFVRTMGELDDERHFRAVHSRERGRRLRGGPSRGAADG
jgi:hypothetical protein